MKFKGLFMKRKSHYDENNSVRYVDSSIVKKDLFPAKKETEVFPPKPTQMSSLYATMRRPKKNPYSRSYKTDVAATTNTEIKEEFDSTVIHNVEKVRINGRPIHTDVSTSVYLDEPSFDDDGYHTLSSRTNPWRNYETDVMNANLEIFSHKNTNVHANNKNDYDFTNNIKNNNYNDDVGDDDENIEYNDRKRISSIKRRSKHARYSNPSFKLDLHSCCEGKQEDWSVIVSNKFVSEIKLPNYKTPERKRANTSRNKVINRSTTMYWDEKVESPTTPETLVFNVSMNAKIQTRFQDNILHSAATNGNIDIVRFYAASDQYLNSQNGFKNTPLHCAVTGRHNDIINVLLENNTDLALQNIDGDTTLHLAVKQSMDSLVHKLLSIDNSCVNLQNKNGDTALHQAVLQNSNYIIDLLINNGALLTIHNNNGDTPLHTMSNIKTPLKRRLLQSALNSDLQRSNSPIDVTKHNHVSITNELNSSNQNYVIRNEMIQSNSTINNNDDDKNCIVNLQNNQGNSLLHCFAKHSEVELVKLILSVSCTKTKLQNLEGDTALHIATTASNLNIVEFLIREDLELLNIANNAGNTILHLAVQAGNIEIVEKLILYGSDVTKRNNVGNTPLQSSIISQNTDTLRLLLKDKQVNLKVQNNEGDFPIHTAIKYGDHEIFKIIVEFAQRQHSSEIQHDNMFVCQENADNIDSNFTLNIDESFGNTPFHLAIKRDIKMNTLLKNRMASFDFKNKDGDTALHLIARYNRINLLEKVNISDIDTEVTNESGYTPWNIAMQHEHVDIAMYLLLKRWDIKMDI